MKKSDNKKLAVGALLIAGAGYLAGILTAPKKGSETRKDIVDAGIKTKAEAEKTFKKINAELTDLLKQAEVFAGKSKTAVKEELSQRVNDAKKANVTVREVLSALHEGDAEDKDLKKAVIEGNKAIEHLKKYLKKDDA
jgi:gas vesicle protein